jgi:hypothetical protein
MAEKHKSKYKAPKYFENSQKPEVRKNMKDYVGEDAPNMVPGGVKGVVPNVPRKYATEVIDNVENMVPEIKERLYKKLEEGEYSPEHARKVFEKLQIQDTEGFLEKLERINHGAITNSEVKPKSKEEIKEAINRLTEEQKEQLVRKYVRKKIAKIIKEQGEPAPDAAPEETPEEAPAPDAAPPADATAAPDAAPPAEAPMPTEEPPAEEETEETPEAKAKRVEAEVKEIRKKYVNQVLKGYLVDEDEVGFASQIVTDLEKAIIGMKPDKFEMLKQNLIDAMKNLELTVVKTKK